MMSCEAWRGGACAARRPGSALPPARHGVAGPCARRTDAPSGAACHRTGCDCMGRAISIEIGSIPARAAGPRSPRIAASCRNTARSPGTPGRCA
ncbi:hypothetical protein CAL28_09385 [Bordetella genomosp. 11]|uniref:Uncharacterized protein n=1 Tax=Bordetella genomosp. 11 TaxID=1416808 RepID=A0A261UFQ3_9BORD|nr:hypothetical protein CAL28_09385 [Bordetella genomosp. 11]